MVPQGGEPVAFLHIAKGDAPTTVFRSNYVTTGLASVTDNSEAQNNHVLGSPATVANAKIRVIFNDFTVGATTFTLCKNGVPVVPAVAVVVPAGITGLFSTAPGDQASFAAGDRLSWRSIATAEAGKTVVAQVAYDIKNRPGGMMVISESFVGGALPATRFFLTPASHDAVGEYPINTVLATVQAPVPSAQTINMVTITTSPNTFVAPIGVTLQVNGVDTPIGTLVLGIGVATLVGTQPVAAGDLVSVKIVLPAEPGKVVGIRVSYKTQSAMGGIQPLIAIVRGAVLPYFLGAGIGGAHVATIAEAEVHWAVPGPGSINGPTARLNVVTNGLSMPATVTLRINGVDTTVTFVIPPAFTGVLIAASGLVPVVAGSLISVKVMTSPLDIGSEARAFLSYEFV